MLRKTLRDQKVLPGHSHSDDREIKNNGQRDIRSRKTSCRNVKCTQDNLTLVRDSQQNLPEAPLKQWGAHLA